MVKTSFFIICFALSCTFLFPLFQASHEVTVLPNTTISIALHLQQPSLYFEVLDSALVQVRMSRYYGNSLVLIAQFELRGVQTIPELSAGIYLVEFHSEELTEVQIDPRGFVYWQMGALLFFGLILLIRFYQRLGQE